MVMKSPIQLLQEVKKLVFQEETIPAPAYSLKDGTKIMIDKLEVGGMVTLEDGTPAPVGEHELADGSYIVLGEGGIIAEIKPKMEEPKVEIEVDSAADEKKDDAIEEMKAKIKAIEEEMAKNKEKMAAFESLKTSFSKQSEAMQGLIQLVDTLVNVPSQAPAEMPNSFKKHSAETKADRIRNYSQFVSQFKNK